MSHSKCHTSISIPICICANHSKISMMSNTKLTKLDGKLKSKLFYHQNCAKFKIAFSKHWSLNSLVFLNDLIVHISVSYL